MSRKNPIYWTIRNQYGSYSVAGVISKSDGGRILNCSFDGVSFRSHSYDCYGTFSSEQAAKDALGGIQDIKRRWGKVQTEINRELNIARNKETAEIEQYLKDNQGVAS